MGENMLFLFYWYDSGEKKLNTGGIETPIKYHETDGIVIALGVLVYIVLDFMIVDIQHRKVKHVF